MHAASTARLRLLRDVGEHGTGWIPTADDSHPWLRVDMGGLYKIRAVVTQGCGDQAAWVTQFCISFVSGFNQTVYYGGMDKQDCKVIRMI